MIWNSSDLLNAIVGHLVKAMILKREYWTFIGENRVFKSFQRERDYMYRNKSYFDQNNHAFT